MGKFNLKKTALLCMMAVMVFAMTACGKNSTASGKEEDGKLKVVTTIFPYYDFVRQIAGDKVSLSMAVPAALMPRSSSIMSLAVSLSRLPVGSSASMREGLLSKALAMAILCCSPPESW